DSWNFHDPDGNYADAGDTVSDSIARADAVIQVTRYDVTYDGNPHTATGTATGVKGEDLLGAGDVLNLSGTTHTNAGDYPNDLWAFTDVTGDYNNAGGTASDLIRKADATISVTPY